MNGSTLNSKRTTLGELETSILVIFLIFLTCFFAASAFADINQKKYPQNNLKPTGKNSNQLNRQFESKPLLEPAKPKKLSKHIHYNKLQNSKRLQHSKLIKRIKKEPASPTKVKLITDVNRQTQTTAKKSKKFQIYKRKRLLKVETEDRILNEFFVYKIFPATSNLGQYFGTVSLGPSWGKGGRTQTFYLQPDLEKTYTSTGRNSIFANWEVFAGYQDSLDCFYFSPFPLLGQIGLAIATTTPVSLYGDIWEDADPDFDNYFYRYKVDHTHIAIKGKLSAKTYLEPYISGSIGVGFNHAHDFIITPKIYEEVPAPPFSNKNTTSVAYTLGIGVQTMIGSHVQLSMGYEFQNWGQSHLGRAPEQTLSSGLSLSHLFTHGLQFSLSYFI